MQAASQTRRLTKGGLVLRDSITFAVLCSASVVLFLLTLLLFRSFEGHRSNLAKQWAARGNAALQGGKSNEAVAAFRTALSFEPNERTNQLLLAQALAAAGKNEEASSYFLNLWESRPGDGFLNLQLARLARARGDEREAVNDYRAAIFGSWEGDGAERRRQTRFELADYLASKGDDTNARMEILVAAGNAPQREDLELVFGDKLVDMGDAADALTYYRKAIQNDPLRESPLEKAGRAAFSLGRYKEAAPFLDRALSRARRDGSKSKVQELAELARRNQDVIDMDLSRALPAVERTQHLLAALAVSGKRLQSCSAQLLGQTAAEQRNGATSLPVGMLALKARWAAERTANTRQSLEHNAAQEDTAMALVFDTERETASLCGAPLGDDAVLLMLANASAAQ